MLEKNRQYALNMRLVQLLQMLGKSDGEERPYPDLEAEASQILNEFTAKQNPEENEPNSYLLNYGWEENCMVWHEEGSSIISVSGLFDMSDPIDEARFWAVDALVRILKFRSSAIVREESVHTLRRNLLHYLDLSDNLPVDDGGGKSAEAASVVQVDVEASVIQINGQSFSFRGSESVKKCVAEFYRELIEADGEYLCMGERVRTRHLEIQADEVRDLIEAQPGAGTRIPREKLWRN